MVPSVLWKGRIKFYRTALDFYSAFLFKALKACPVTVA